jgi:thiol-disulfide isomerase/thioredoxin
MKAQLLTLIVLVAVGCRAQTYTLSIERESLASKIKDLRGEHIRMPRLPLDYPADRYIHVSAHELPALMKDKIVLLDVWDYTCVNCIRTLPYIQSWHEKYKDLGLVIIGIHTPEFEFAKQRANVETEMRRFGLTHPVILDNEYEIWDSLANKYWPAKYIFGTDNKLRAEHHGEGEYHEFEAFIQKLLLERDPSVVLPELTPLLRATDVPGAVCYRTTPELYLGFERSRYGNETQVEVNKPKFYAAIEPHTPDSAHLEGMWEVKRQFAKPVGGDTSRLIVSYQAKEVNLVIRPERTQGFKVYVEQDFGPLAPADFGRDILRESDGRAYIWVDQPRMYQIVNNKTFSRYTLKLASNSPDFCAYAFTFSTDCVPPDAE